MGSLRDRYIEGMIESLADDGYDLIIEAAMSNDTHPRTQNMRDAYGAAVFYNGKRVATRYVNQNPLSDKVHKGWAKHGISPNTGRGYLDEYFDMYRAKPKGFELICVNVIYYTSILENGAQGRPRVEMSRKYKIISQIGSQFNDLTKKYKGSTAKVIKL